MTEKIIRNIILFLGGLALFTPLFVSLVIFYPFTTLKVTIYRLVIALMLIFWLFLLSKNPNYYWFNLKSNKIFWGGLIFIVVITISSFFGVDFYNSFWSGTERMAGIISYLFSFIYYVILISLKPKKEELEGLLNIHFGVNLLVIISALLGYTNGFIDKSFRGARLTGLSGNPSFLAIYLLFTSFLALAYAGKYYKRNKIKFLVYLGLFLINAVAIFGTGTRGAMLGWGIGGLIYLIYVSVRFYKEKIGKAAIIILITGAVSIGALFSFKDTQLVKTNIGLSRLTSIINFKTDTSAQTRVYSAQTAIRMWRAKPIFGWGLDNYKWGFLKHFIPQMVNNNPNDVTLDKAHNMPLEILATTGFIGFIAFLFFYYCISADAKMAWKIHSDRQLFILPLFLGIVAYFIFNIFLFDVFESFLMLPLVLVMIDSLTGTDSSVKRVNVNKTLSSWVPIIGTLCIIFFVYSGILQPLQTSIEYGMANYYIKGHKTEKIILSLSKIINNNDFAVRKDLIGLITNYINETDYLDTNTKLNATSLLNRVLDKEIQKFPMFLDLQSIQVRLSLYGSDPNSADINKVTIMQQKLVDYAPNFLNYRVDQAFLYGLNGDFDRSLKESDFVLSKTSKLPQAFWYKGIVLYQKGQRQAALDNYLLALKNGYSISSSDLQTLKGLAQLNNRTDILDYIKMNYKNS